jgi:hypothetical protein|tara:strand:+ start:3790 stop:4068 length:279 start_codon:yes stop_codon:yes gene_type:complete
MKFDIVDFYDEKLEDLGKEKVGFPRKYFELSYDQRMFFTDICEDILLAKQKTEDLDDAVANLTDHSRDLRGVLSEFDSTIESVRSLLEQVKK